MFQSYASHGLRANWQLHGFIQVGEPAQRKARSHILALISLSAREIVVAGAPVFKMDHLAMIERAKIIRVEHLLERAEGD
jgi:hypothetical protein